MAAAVPTPDQLRAIREETGSTPSDTTIEDLWRDLRSVPAVALAVLRPRLADALDSRSLSIPGAISVGAPADPKYLAGQIARLEGLLAAESGEPDATGLGASSVIVSRTDRIR